MIKMCKITTGADNKAIFDSATVEGAIIEGDKPYKFLIPKNGVITYSITNSDGEIKEKNVRKAVALALTEWGLHVPVKFKHVKINGDVQVKFMSEDNDSILTSNTLAYMYYPMGGLTNGKCVINTRFYWTNSGKAVNMNSIDPIHYPDASKAPVQGESWDLDQVLRHEFGHGVFGLPHTQSRNKIMSANYGFMEEHLTEEDIFRACAKLGSRKMNSELLKRWTDWLEKSSDRD